MWKRKLCKCPINFTSLLRSSASISHDYNYNCSISNKFYSLFSYLFPGRIDGKHIPSDSGLNFRNPRIVLTNLNEFWFTKNEHLFCSQPEILHCWNCGAGGSNATPLLFCEACCSVQPVDDSVDYFQIFGLRREYNIKVEDLEGKYKDWQKKLHPDLVHSKSQREREYAADQSARVIDAYRTLCDPLKRAIYMMKLQGVPHDEEERITDTELLVEIMELREAVEEAEGTEALSQIQAQLKEKLEYWSKSFEDAFSNIRYEDAVASIRRMTYYRRADEEIVKKL